MRGALYSLGLGKYYRRSQMSLPDESRANPHALSFGMTAVALILLPPITTVNLGYASIEGRGLREYHWQYPATPDQGFAKAHES